MVIGALWIWWSSHEVDVEVRGWATWLLMAFAPELLVVVWIHSGFDFNLLVANSHGSGFTVKTNCLLLVTNRFDAARVELLQSSWHLHLNSWHRWELWLIDTSMGGAKEAALNFSATSITNIVERIIFQEVTIKDLVTILLVDVATMK